MLDRGNVTRMKMQRGEREATARQERRLSGAARAVPRVSERSRLHVQEVLDHGFHNTSSAGMVRRLEEQFAAKFNVRYAIAQCNGTATMHAALLAAGVGAGDEVIVPTLTMASTALVALYACAVPVFADIDPRTFTIDVNDVRRKVTPRTRAIIPVSIYGLSMDMDGLMELAREHNLTVIEDDAQCFLGYYKGRVVGSIGHFASFSFQGSKHMTCGDGGILITDDEDRATRARRAAVLGYSTLSAQPGATSIPQELRCHPSFARHASLGYNFRLPEIAAAVALGELERLEQLVANRQHAATAFDAVVRNCSWLTPQHVPDDCVHSYWTYAAVIAEDGPDWSALRQKFVELGGDGFYGAWLPVHREPVFRDLGQAVREHPERYPHFAGVMPDYREVVCPVWERMQPRMVQFKIDSYDPDYAEAQAELLQRTLKHFS